MKEQKKRDRGRCIPINSLALGVTIFAALMTLIVATAHNAQATSAGSCDLRGMESANVETDVALWEGSSYGPYVGVDTYISVPRSWDFSSGLLLSTGSSAYHQSMRCLLENGTTDRALHTDKRYSLPDVTADEDWVYVWDYTEAHLRNRSPHRAGPWLTQFTNSGYQLRLDPPPALLSSPWKVELTKSSKDKLLSTDDVAPDAHKNKNSYSWTELSPSQAIKLRMSLSAPWPVHTITELNTHPADIWAEAGFLFYLIIVPAVYLLVRRRERTPVPRSPNVRALDWALRMQVTLGILHFTQYALTSEPTALIEWTCVSYAIFRRGALRYVRHIPSEIIAIAFTAGLIVLEFCGGPTTASIAFFLINALFFVGLSGVCVIAWNDGFGRHSSPRNLIHAAIFGLAVGTSIPGVYIANRVKEIQQYEWLSYVRHIDIAGLLRSYPSDFLAEIAADWWIVVLLMLIPALAQFHYVDRITKSTHLLVALLGSIALLGTPNPYAGFPVPVEMFTGTGILLLLMKIYRKHVVLDKPISMPDSRLPARTLAESLDEIHLTATAHLQSAVIEYNTLQREGRKLDKTYRTTSSMSVDEYRQNRRNIAHGLNSLSEWPPPQSESPPSSVSNDPPTGTAVGHLPDGVSPVDVLLNLGPARTPWRNGLHASLVSTLLGLPVAAIVIFHDFDQAWWISEAKSEFGPIWLLVDAMYYILPSVAGGFMLGFFWRELPGRRGPIKALPIIAAYTAAFGVDSFLRHLLGQPLASDVRGPVISFVALIAITSIAMDAMSLRKIQARWTTFWNPLVLVYRLEALPTGLAFAVAQITAIVALWFQLRNGLHPTPMDGSGNN